jgi:hypothetical protein
MPTLRISDLEVAKQTELGKGTSSSRADTSPKNAPVLRLRECDPLCAESYGLASERM